MKVGIFLADHVPTYGGSYTFVTSLLAAFDRARSACCHEFILCHEAGGSDVARLFPKFPTIDLEAARLGARTLKERISLTIPALIRGGFPRFKSPFRDGDVASTWRVPRLKTGGRVKALPTRLKELQFLAPLGLSAAIIMSPKQCALA